jgi:hypothetical protein
MFRFLSATPLLLLAGLVFAFPTDLEVSANDLAIAAQVHTDGRNAIVNVSNSEDFAVRCDALFRNGPEMGRVRRAIIEPGESAPLSWTPRREVVRLRIELECRPARAAGG